MNRTDEYGWTSDIGPPSCDYLAPAVLGLLAELKPRAVLDVGAGNGALCRELVAAGYAVTGVEPDQEGVALARRQCPDASFYQLGVEDDPAPVVRDFPDGFDAVIATEVVEHLYAPSKLLTFVQAVFKHNGDFVLTTPYHGDLKNLAIAVLNA